MIHEPRVFQAARILQPPTESNIAAANTAFKQYQDTVMKLKVIFPQGVKATATRDTADQKETKDTIAMQQRRLKPEREPDAKEADVYDLIANYDKQQKECKKLLMQCRAS